MSIINDFLWKKKGKKYESIFNLFTKKKTFEHGT